MKCLTACKPLEGISEACPSRSVSTFPFLHAGLLLAMPFLASLQDLSRKIIEMKEEPNGRKPAEVTQTTEECTNFPLPASNSAAGLEVLSSLLRDSCPSSLLSASLLRPLVWGSVVGAAYSPCSQQRQSNPCLHGSAQHLSMPIISSPFSKTLSHMLTFNYVLKDLWACILVSWTARNLMRRLKLSTQWFPGSGPKEEIALPDVYK